MSRPTKIIRAEAETVHDAPMQVKDFDIMEMPFEGLVAYWLSIKKLVDMKRSAKFLEEEAEHTDEPYIRHLLRVGFEPMPEEVVRRMAQVRRDAILTTYRRKLQVMALALASMATGRNPRLILPELLSCFPAPPIGEAEAVKMANGLISGLKEGNLDRQTVLKVSQRMTADRLVVKLLFYLILARREGPEALRPLLKLVGCGYFAEGLLLVMDDFESAFIRKCLERRRSELLLETRRKMQMSEDMFVAIRMKMNYEQVRLIGNSYII